MEDAKLCMACRLQMDVILGTDTSALGHEKVSVANSLYYINLACLLPYSQAR